jgi:ElaB/YqjD/DUF883 family membrane-anchored ribosome-binding protein
MTMLLVAGLAAGCGQKQEAAPEAEPPAETEESTGAAILEKMEGAAEVISEEVGVTTGVVMEKAGEMLENAESIASEAVQQGVEIIDNLGESVSEVVEVATEEIEKVREEAVQAFEEAKQTLEQKTSAEEIDETRAEAVNGFEQAEQTITELDTPPADGDIETVEAQEAVGDTEIVEVETETIPEPPTLEVTPAETAETTSLAEEEPALAPELSVPPETVAPAVIEEPAESP